MLGNSFLEFVLEKEKRARKSPQNVHSRVSRDKCAFKLRESAIKDKSTQSKGGPLALLRGLYPACKYFGAAHDANDHSHLPETLAGLRAHKTPFIFLLPHWLFLFGLYC